MTVAFARFRTSPGRSLTRLRMPIPRSILLVLGKAASRTVTAERCPAIHVGLDLRTPPKVRVTARDGRRVHGRVRLPTPVLDRRGGDRGVQLRIRDVLQQPALGSLRRIARVDGRLEVAKSRYSRMTGGAPSDGHELPPAHGNRGRRTNADRARNFAPWN
jgi:hypothetical protein